MNFEYPMSKFNTSLFDIRRSIFVVQFLMLPCPAFEYAAGGFFDGAGENKGLLIDIMYQVF